MQGVARQLKPEEGLLFLRELRAVPYTMGVYVLRQGGTLVRLGSVPNHLLSSFERDVYTGCVLEIEKLEGAQGHKVHLVAHTFGVPLVSPPLPAGLGGTERGLALAQRADRNTVFAQRVMREACFKCDVSDASDTSMCMVPD